MEFNPIGLFLSRQGIVIAFIIVIVCTILHDLIKTAGM